MSDEYEDKFTALTKLSGSAAGFDITRKAVYSGSPEMRLIAVSNLDAVRDKKVLNKLALEDPSSKIRTTALKKTKDYNVALQLVQSDQSYRVISEALNIVHDKKPKEGLRQAQGLTVQPHKPLIGSISAIFAQSGETRFLEYFEENIDDVGMYVYFNFINEYGKLAKQASVNRIEKTAGVLKDVATDVSNTYFKKYATASLINSLISEIKTRPKEEKDSAQVINNLKNMMTEIVNGSNDERMHNAFAQYIESP